MLRKKKIKNHRAVSQCSKACFAKQIKINSKTHLYGGFFLCHYPLVKKALPQQWLITASDKIEPLTAAKKLSGNSGVILRDYDLDFSARLALGRKLKKICLQKKLVFLVAADAKLALALQADGIHLPEHLIKEGHKWRHKKPDWLITAAVHSPRAIIAAGREKADAVFISPVFATDSHPEKKPLGIMRAKQYIYSVNREIPAYALGGVKTKYMKALKMADFCGFAGISWLKN